MDHDGAALIARLRDGSLPPPQFSHRNHIHAAWHCLQQAPLPEAAQRFLDLLRGYTRHVGAEQKFHETLTRSFMHLIHERLLPDEAWPAFEARNPDLFLHAQTLIGQHYSPARLILGQTVFVEPDRLPLP